MPSDDPRRVLVIDPATDNVTTIIGKASAAPGVGELRERIAVTVKAEYDKLPVEKYPHEMTVAEAVMRVILDEGDS